MCIRDSSQYVGAYSVATIDKASEVLVKQKDVQIAIFEEQVVGDQQKIIQLEQRLQDAELRTKQLEEQLSLENNKIDEEALDKQHQLNQEVEKLQNLLQSERNSKIEQEKMFQSALDKFKDYPKLDQFKMKLLK